MASVNFFVWREASIVDANYCLCLLRFPDPKRFDIPRVVGFFVLVFSLGGSQRFSRKRTAMMSCCSKTKATSKDIRSRIQQPFSVAKSLLVLL